MPAMSTKVSKPSSASGAAIWGPQFLRWKAGWLAGCLLVSLGGAAAGLNGNADLGPRAGEGLPGFQPAVGSATFFTK